MESQDKEETTLKVVMENVDENIDKDSANAILSPSTPATHVPKPVTKGKKPWKDVSGQSSHTKYYRRPSPLAEFKHVTRDEYLSVSESISGSVDTLNCIHGPQGKQYTQKELLKRNLTKNLDPIRFDHKKTDACSTSKWDVAQMLEFMVTSPTVEHQLERLQLHLRDFARTSSNGYADQNVSFLREEIIMLLTNLQKPILLTSATDAVTYIDEIANFMGFMAYLLIKLDDIMLFDIVAKAIIFHLSAPDKVRGPGTVHLRHTLIAAGPVVRQTIVRMVALADNHRFPTYLEITFLLACDTAENCIEMMKENIIENIFYRFNPYFPEKILPYYDINPFDCQDANIKLGICSFHISQVLSLLLVLLKTTKQYLEENPGFKKLLPTPDCYAQRCFIWAYRYECRVREHHHQRITLTVIAALLVNCYGEKLRLFSSILMPDVMSLSVLSELPARKDWIATVNFTTRQKDVQFKIALIHLVVYLFKAFPYNKVMLQTQHWFLGLVYLLDPGLSALRSRWSPTLFADIRKTALQALVCTIPLIDPKLANQYGLIRRIMWYIEWYTESPYELPILYWCVRLLQVAIHHRHNPERGIAIRDLFDTHGIIILMNLCHTLTGQKKTNSIHRSMPPVEKGQAIIALSLRMLTSAVVANGRVSCIVYPTIKWPASINGVAWHMMNEVIYALEKNYIISDRWLISLMNFIWEAIVWKSKRREEFVADGGIYKLLDLITMTRPPVRCIALALVCDITRAGKAIGQLVSWRAGLGASNANPKILVVNPGATIASLLAALFREECMASGVRLDKDGVLQDLNCPIMSKDARYELFNTEKDIVSLNTLTCIAAAELAGSCMSKAFAILHMLTEDLENKVSLADESYNLYKNIKLPAKDEAILVLCSHYLTLKLSEVWREIEVEVDSLFVTDDDILKDFLNVGKGWAKEIQRQQKDVIAQDRKRELEQESSLYAFLGRVRLNIALDALRSVRCVARSTEHKNITQALLHDAVLAQHRRGEFAENTLLRTYYPPLDDQNITGQNVKVISIRPKANEDQEQGYCSCSVGGDSVCVPDCLYKKKRPDKPKK